MSEAKIKEYKDSLAKNKEYVEQLKAELDKSMAKHHQLLGAIYALENLPKPVEVVEAK